MGARTKRVISLVLMLATLLVMIPAVQLTANATNTYIINNVSIKFTDYTSSPHECWVYANNFYRKIWGEEFTNQFSVDNSLRDLSDEELTLTEEHLREYVSNAVLGACLRICNEEYLHGTDGWGHSQIIVQKDSNGFTVFEGGLQDAPYCQEKYYTWSEYIETSWLGGTYQYIKYIKWPDAPTYSSGINTCTEAVYPCSVRLRITEDCYAYTLPCNSNTAEALGLTSVKLTDQLLSEGTAVTATALYQNTQGNYWYCVTMPDGTSAYLYCTHCTCTGAVSPVVENGSFPASITGSTALKGTLTTDGTIDTVRAVVYEGTATAGTVAISSDAVTVNAGSYALSGSTVDNSLRFKELAELGEGYYTLTYEVSYFSYYADGNTLSTVSASSHVGAYTFYYGPDGSCGCSATYAGTYVCTTESSGLNIRSGHGTSYSILGNIPSGATVTVTKASGTGADDWAHVEYNGISGYASMQYLARKTYTVSYNANGGTGAPDSQTKIHGETLILSAAVPTWDGYTFLGWSSIATATTATYSAGASFNTNGNVILYAIWQKGCAAEHSYGDWETVTAATCTGTGERCRTCTLCGYTETEETAAVGHSYSAVVTEPTCTEQGYTTHTCHCGDSYVDSYTEPTGHETGANGVCQYCGYQSYLLGDINGDGTVDIFDANAAAAYANELRDLDDTQLLAGDVNGDGEVDIFDANLIAAYANELLARFPAES